MVPQKWVTHCFLFDTGLSQQFISFLRFRLQNTFKSKNISLTASREYKTCFSDLSHDLLSYNKKGGQCDLFKTCRINLRASSAVQDDNAFKGW